MDQADDEKAVSTGTSSPGEISVSIWRDFR
jgi:hypothetical protein